MFKAGFDTGNQSILALKKDAFSYILTVCNHAYVQKKIGLQNDVHDIALEFLENCVTTI